MTKSFKELERVVKKLNEKLVNAGFTPVENEENKKVISIFIPEGIDNCYNKQYDWRWEIYLYDDGTWKIV